jgi:hypothetical protein
MRYADLDRNHNGMIEKNEWRGSPRSFTIHDWNGDGVLSGEEVRQGAVPPNNSLEAQDYNMTAGDRFSYLDVNNTGRSTATNGMEASTRSISSTATTTAGSPGSS